MNDNQLRRALKPDAQAFDEIRITTVPRFKDSGLSGSEWRISSLTEFYRKGKLVHSVGHGNIEYACRLLDHDFIAACEDGKAFFAGENDVCDQEGCSEKATVSLEQIKEGCGQCGNTKTPEYSRPIRKFCDRHKHRGDSSLDDADDCYKEIAS